MNTKKNHVLLITIILLVVIIGSLAYKTNQSKIPEPPEDRAANDLKDAQKYFPKKIGEYTLREDEARKIHVKHQCNKIEDNPLLQATGRTGDACMTIYVGEYWGPAATTTSGTFATSTNPIAVVNLSKFTEAGDLLRTLVEQTGHPETFDGRIVYRINPFSIGWYSESDFDFVVVLQGSRVYTSTREAISYAGMASSTHPVMQYFMKEYK